MSPEPSLSRRTRLGAVLLITPVILRVALGFDFAVSKPTHGLASLLWTSSFLL